VALLSVSIGIILQATDTFQVDQLPRSKRGYHVTMHRKSDLLGLKCIRINHQLPRPIQRPYLLLMPADGTVISPTVLAHQLLDSLAITEGLCVCVCVYLTSVRKHVIKSRVLKALEGQRTPGGFKPSGCLSS
jgi:hypothetical protein